MADEAKIFRDDLEKLPRIIPTVYRLAGAGWLPDQVVIHRGNALKALYICVVLNSRGNGVGLVNGRTNAVPPSPKLAILRPGTRLVTLRPDCHDEVFFKYREPDASRVMALGLKPGHFSMTGGIDSALAELHGAIANCWAPGGIDRLDLLAMRLFTEIGLSMRQHSGGTARKLEALASYLLLHLSEHLDIGMLARRFSMSRSSLYRNWKEHFGIGIMAFVQRERLRMAEQLLLESGITVGEIAERCGFGSSAYLHECFRRKNRCSPLEFRRNRRNYPDHFHSTADNQPSL